MSIKEIGSIDVKNFFKGTSFNFGETIRKDKRNEDDATKAKLKNRVKFGFFSTKYAVPTLPMKIAISTIPSILNRDFIDTFLLLLIPSICFTL